LYDPQVLKVKLEEALDIYNFLIKRHDEAQQEDLNELLDKNLKQAERLKPFVGNVIAELKAFQESNKAILFEGAQGALLDYSLGTYPFVTSSNTVAASAATGTGCGPDSIQYVLGITKSYTTRVGEGPFQLN
jgi:adenylosuccinate synthase